MQPTPVPRALRPPRARRTARRRRRAKGDRPEATSGCAACHVGITRPSTRPQHLVDGTVSPRSRSFLMARCVGHHAPRWRARKPSAAGRQIGRRRRRGTPCGCRPRPPASTPRRAPPLPGGTDVGTRRDGHGDRRFRMTCSPRPNLGLGRLGPAVPARSTTRTPGPRHEVVGHGARARGARLSGHMTSSPSSGGSAQMTAG